MNNLENLELAITCFCCSYLSISLYNIINKTFRKKNSIIHEFIKKGSKDGLWIDGALFINDNKLICTVFTEHAIPKLVICNVKVSNNCFNVYNNGYIIATINR